MTRHRKDGIDPVLRSRARRRALQAVYAWQVSGGDANGVVAQFAHEQAHEIADLVYFDDLVRGVIRHVRELDAALAGFIDRTVEEVDQIERAALRIAAYELLHRPDVPYRVVINALRLRARAYVCQWRAGSGGRAVAHRRGPGSEEIESPFVGFNCARRRAGEHRD